MNAKLIRTTALVIGLFSSCGVYAQHTVIVNGVLLDEVQLNQLEQLACTVVPDGNYWIDMNLGAWGFAGNPVLMGYVGDACRQNQRRKSLSERGLLYSPGELLR